MPVLPQVLRDEHLQMRARIEVVRRVLYGLYAIIRLHLAKEEEISLPILEARIPADEVDHLVEAMDRSVTEAKSALIKNI